MDFADIADDEVLPNALMLVRQGRFAQAVPLLRRARRTLRRDARVLRGLVECLLSQGQVAEAIEQIDELIGLSPNDASPQSARLVWSYFDPSLSDAEIFDRHQRWGNRQARLTPAMDLPANDPNPDRKLNIGYLCSTIRSGVTMALFGPLLESHDRSKVTVYCYNNTPAPDTITQIVRQFADHWREVVGHTDEAVANLIRADGIDILIDLDLHLPPNRMAVSAMKPAPIHIAALQYPGTSGLSTMDYVLVDHNMLFPGCDAYFTEKLLAVETLWIFRRRGPTSTEEVSAYELTPPPATKNGFVTFGSLNNAPKLNAPLFRAWRRILEATGDSRLIIQIKGATGGQVALLGEFGSLQHRVEVVDALPQRAYIETYRRIDIALDPFPYGGGGGTAFDVLWAGLPLVTLAGNRPTSRYGVSILASMNLGGMVASTIEQYISIATRLAADVPGLVSLRQSMRDRMSASILMDEARYARSIEAAYRFAWRDWCKQRLKSG